MLPMLAVRATFPPGGREWVHEVKWDGMRALADIRVGLLHLRTRSGRSATDRFPELARLAARHDDLLLDGEICVLNRGLCHYAALAERIHVRDRATAMAMAHGQPVSYVIFDVLRVRGRQVADRPWHERRALLESLGLRGPRWQVSPTYDDGQSLFATTLEQGHEGVVSKRRDSTYRAGVRSHDWIKAPHRPLFSVVVGGWRAHHGHRGRVATLLLGMPGPQGLRFLGPVHDGLADRSQVDLLSELHPRARSSSPFLDAPRGPGLGEVTWVEPEVVVDVRAVGIGAAGELREPSYQRLRPDMDPEAILDEIPDTQAHDGGGTGRGGGQGGGGGAA